MKIEYITYPYVYTDDGYRFEIDKITEGIPRVGSEIIRTTDGYKVLASGDQSECVNGVCPVR